MSNMNLEDKILKAMDIIASRKTAAAGYDKTIQATVLSCADSTKGKYKIQYQDSYFYAYSANTDITYTSGASVYILVPGSDFSKQKTIIGAVESSNVQYITSLDGDQAYVYTGENTAKGINNIEIGINSYHIHDTGENKYTQIVYRYGTSSGNKITIDQTRLKKYLNDANYLICGSEIKTSLPSEQKAKGNYGIIFTLRFKDSNGNSKIKTYTVDINKMSGNPYNYNNYTRQFGIFTIDGTKFERLEKIEIFSSNFPNTKNGIDENDYDIFFKNIQINGANKMSEEELSSYALIIQPSSIYFTQDEAETATKTLKAQVRIKGIPASASQNIRYFWFVEDATISSDSSFYCQYGGRGWRCLNDSKVLANGVIEWIPAKSTYIVTKLDILCKELKYKCVAIYEGSALNRQIFVMNQGGRIITVESDSGTDFFYDTGEPTLTCKIDGAYNSNYKYIWSVVNSDGSFSLLLDLDSTATTAYNKAVTNYETAINNYNTINTQLKNKQRLKTQGAKDLAAAQTNIDNCLVTLASYTSDNINAAVYKNQVIKIPITTVEGYAIYKCSIWDNNNNFIGTGSIKLTNNLNQSYGYTLAITNGVQTYKYNEQGISPTSDALINPIAIQSLSFILYDPTGRIVFDSAGTGLINSKFQYIDWIMPATNSMLVPSGIENYTLIDDNYIFDNYGSLSYKINSSYDISRKKNNITLVVGYQDMVLIAETDLNFIKQGEAGTNGTDFVCKIQPWVKNGTTIPYYPTIYIDKNGSSYSFIDNDSHFNFTPVYHNGRWFRLKLYHNDELVYSSDGSVNRVSATVTWSTAYNTYNASTKDAQAIECTNASNGTFKVNPSFLARSGSTSVPQSPACVIKAQVRYNNVLEYAYLPIVFSLHNANYSINLNEYTGFNMAVYTGDGKSPMYDFSHPHTLTVTQKINNLDQDITDITLSQYKLTYTWSLMGSMAYMSNKKWLWNNAATLLLKNNLTTDSIATYQYKCKPKDDFNNICRTNNVRCIIKQGNTEIGRIIMPVHLMLNQYGSARLNGWDGNSIQIDNDGGVILSPQVGAGKKNSDNTYTGVLMGEVKKNESGLSKTYNGLIGLSKGILSFHLDAETGKAIFGVTGKGQIILDPTGSSTIGGWVIDTNSIHSTNKTGIGTNTAGGFLGSNGTFEFRASNGNYLQYNGTNFTLQGGTIKGGSIQIGKKFSVDSNGNMTATDGKFTGTISGGTITIGSNFSVNSSGVMTAKEANFSGKITGSEIDINNKTFYVDKRGNLIAKSGTFSGTVSGGKIIGGSIDINNGIFKVDSNGTLTAKSGIFSGLVSGGSISIGSKNGRPVFSVDVNGNMIANEGTFKGDIDINDGFFAVNDTTIDLGDWHIENKRRDAFFYGDFDNSLVGMSGKQKQKDNYCFWAGWDSNTGFPALGVQKRGSSWKVVLDGTQVYPYDSYFYGGTSRRWWNLTETLEWLDDRITYLENNMDYEEDDDEEDW